MILYVKNVLLNSAWKEMSEVGGTSAGMMNGGAHSGVGASLGYARLNSGSGGATIYGATVVPDGIILAANKDCVRSLITFTRTIPAGYWRFFYTLTKASGSVGTTTLRINVIFHKGPNADGTGAIAISPFVVGEVKNCIGTAGVGELNTLEVFYNSPEVILNNEYLFVQLGFELTVAPGAGGNMTAGIGVGRSRLVLPELSTGNNAMSGLSGMSGGTEIEDV